MRTPRLLAAAAAVLAMAGCTDRSATISAPDGPRGTYITSVYISCPPSIQVGVTSGCSAWAMDSNGNQSNQTFSAGWGSTAPGVLGVGSTGMITGISAGNAAVYAVVGGVWGWSGNISVYNPPYPATVTVTPGSSTIATGQLGFYAATVKDQYGNTMSGQSVTWSSSNTSVATVSSGVVTGVSPGSATITATAGSASGTASVSVVTAFNVSIGGESQVKPNNQCTWWAEVDGGVAPYSYSWWVPSGNGSSVYEPSSWTGSFSGGTYTIHLTVTDARGIGVSTSRQVSTSTSLPSNWVCEL